METKAVVPDSFVRQRVPIKRYIFLVAFLFIFIPTAVFSAVKDSDVDGLTDEGEVGVYQTSPLMYDTDGDGVGDGEEVLDGTNPLDANSSRIVSLQSPDPGFLGEPQKFAWYMARISGIVAFILFSLVVVYGLFVSCARVFMKLVLPPTALAFHRYLSFLALSVVLLHASSFLFDDFLNLTVFEIFTPFLLNRGFTSALGYDLGYAVALGIISLYILIVLVITAEFRNKVFPRVWRGIHYLSFAGYVLFVIHGFTAGSDSGEWWMRGIYSMSVIIVGILLVVRIVSSVVLARKKKQTIEIFSK